MPLRPVRPGGWCWIGIALYVAVLDSYLIRKGHATMSEVMGDSLRHPMKRIVLIVFWAVLTLHLFGGVLPSWIRDRMRPYDPIGALARWIESVA